MIRKCKKCGFLLGTRPNLLEVDGVCQACINNEKKKEIDFPARQKWLTQYIRENITNPQYDCIIAVSGGKDSHMIVRRLIENHGVKNPLLVTVADDFTPTAAGRHNIKNLRERFNCDHLVFHGKPLTLREQTKKDFEDELHPLKYLERKIYEIPVDIARNYGIKLCFFGENSAFEYGTGTELEIFHPASTEEIKIIFMGAIYPYSIQDSLECAREIGFKTLDDFNEWPREGCIENYTQMDSIGYQIHLWTKYVKFGFQRVADIACRMVREGTLTKEQAELLIRERDWACDTLARRDFCRAIGITEEYFRTVIDRHANHELVQKDINGNWKRRDQ